MKFYMRYCCGLEYWFSDIIKDSNPIVYTFFTSLLSLVFLILSAVSVIKVIVGITFDTPLNISAVLLAVVALINYLVVFRNSRYMKYYNNRLNLFVTSIIFLLLLGSHLFLAVYAHEKLGNSIL